MKPTAGQKVFGVFNAGSLLVFCVLCIYPLVLVTALSFNDGMDAMRGGIYLWPRVWSLENYRTVLKENRIITSALISVYRTVAGAGLAVILNALFAYALTKKDLPGRGFFLWFILVPMYFGGGIIPYFLVCKALGLINNILVYVLPAIFGPFYILLIRVGLLDVPASLEESAKMDGAGYATIFFRIYFPLSGPILATVALLSGLGHWNDWFDGTVLVLTSRLWPLQTLLLHIIQGADIMSFFKSRNIAMAGSFMKKVPITVESLKMAMLVLTVAPIVALYPFLQRYYIKGAMVGSLKG
ncbi:MAG TPA: carbohydrate ABC transporter permease [Spirochaetia bacterium]|nr:carbohydrate ABC transporter permease [Spirochaetia bacterium]